MVNGVISVVDIDGTHVEGFVPPSLTEFEFYLIDRLVWSRDGSRIAFHAYSDARSVPFEGFGLFVLNLDVSDLRRFETESIDRAWSPDSSMIALEKPVTVSGSAGSVITILDVETGAERVLEATSAVEKDMANRATGPDAFRTYSIRTGHRYAYEGWSWTPMAAASWCPSGMGSARRPSTSRRARPPSAVGFRLGSELVADRRRLGRDEL